MRTKIADAIINLEQGDKIGIRSYDPVSQAADIVRGRGKSGWANGCAGIIERTGDGFVVTGFGEGDTFRVEVPEEVVDAIKTFWAEMSE